MYPIYIKRGSVSIGYHLKSFQDAVNGISTAPSPHKSKAAAAATKPIAPKTL